MSSNPLKARPGGVIEHSPAHATNFRVFVSQFPNIQFFATDTMVPGVNLPEMELPVSRGTAFMNSNKIDFEPMTIGFIVDEHLHSYLEVFEYMTNAYSPNDAREPTIPTIDLDVVALDNNKNPTVTFKFKNAIPTVLGQITYDTQDEGNNNLVCDITLRFDSMKAIRHGSDLPTGLDDAAGDVIE